MEKEVEKGSGHHFIHYRACKMQKLGRKLNNEMGNFSGIPSIEEEELIFSI